MSSPADNRNLPGAVVLDAFATGLNTARALHRRGVRVTVVAMGDSDLAQYSRAVCESVRLTGPVSPEALLELLEANAPRWRQRVLIPASDIALETLSRYREQLSANYRLSVPEWAATRALLRKDRTRQAALACAIEVPDSHGELDEDLARRFEGPFPVVLRPFDGARFIRATGVKALLANDAAELLECARRLRAAGLRTEVLHFVPGPDSCSFNYTAFIDRSGRLVAGCALRKLRKSPPLFGISRVVETVDDDIVEEALREPVLRLLRHVGWFGPVSAEFKRDPRSGRYVLIEVNGRMAFVFRLALARGVDFAWLSYLAARGEELPATTPGAWSGVLIHLYADLGNAVFRRRVERLRWDEFLAPYRRPKVFAVWDARDPLPFLAEWSRTLVRAPVALIARCRAGPRRRAPWPRAAAGKPDAP
jgi:predicted ATP-grasp superfamily ATP-dependent carboligase